ncbi:MAG: MMPL family transporter [Catenulispora sp.]|nr:MMPL family transporter [Catenulispora sp.]
MTASRTTFFERLGRGVVAHPWRVVGGWLALVVVAIAVLPALATRVDPNTSGTLPSTAEASKATRLAQDAFPGRPQSTGVIVFTRHDGAALTEDDNKQVAAVVGNLKAAGVAGVQTVTTSERLIAPNHKSQLGQIAFAENANDKKTVDAVKALRSKTVTLLGGSPLSAGYSGEAPVAADNTDAIAAAAGIVAGATVGLIVILQLLIFRSPVAAFVPVIAVGIVQVVGGGLAGAVSALAGYKVASFAPILVIVVLFGVGTDYILFLLFRYRERLRDGEDPKEALVHALARVGEAVTSAAGVVIVAFCTLLVSPLGSFRTLGPTLAVVVATMLAAGLTLVPAIIALLGEKLFWPSKAWRTARPGTNAARLGRLTARRPGLLASGCALLFGVLALGAIGFSLDYDPVGQLPQDKESATSYNRMLQDFPPGNLAPVVVFLTHDGAAPLDAAGEQAFGAALKAVDGVANVGPAVASADGGTAQFTVILNQDPYSKAALSLVSGPLETAAHTKAPAGTHASVGGPSSAYAGIRDANSDGLKFALPIAAVLIGIILALLLRGVIGTGLLIGVVFLGFAGVFGASVLLFQHAQGKPGLQFVIPLVMYVFVVAIGTDYNILMISRIRDEIRSGATAREAVGAAVTRTAPAVAAAGLVLAGSFAALMLAGIGFLTEMGFAVSLGIALCAFVMAIVLVPGLAAVAGDRFWWPSRPGAPVPPAPPMHARPVAAAESAGERA